MNFLRKTPEALALIGFFILFGTAGTMDVRPEFPLDKLVVQGLIGVALMIPMIVKGWWYQDEQD